MRSELFLNSRGQALYVFRADQARFLVRTTWLTRRRKCCYFCWLIDGVNGEKNWVHDIIRKRRHYGEFHRLVPELRLDEQRFVQYFRMTPGMFDYLLQVVGPIIRKMTTNYRKAISPQQRLAICLR